jgi:hypothetical protein
MFSWQVQKILRLRQRQGVNERADHPGEGFAAVVVPAAAQSYQDGTWRDTERLTKVTGSTSSLVGTTVVTNTTRSVRQKYVIETADLMIVATQPPKWRWSHPVLMTVNAPMRVLIDSEKRRILVIGEGKEYTLDLAKKILKEKT